MKVLMTTDAVGGVWSYALELSHALKSFDVEVVLATMGPSPSEDQRDEARKVENIALVESTFKLEWMDHPWEDVERAGHWLLDLEEKFRPDVIHLNGYAHAAQSWEAPVMAVGHSCVLSWWEAVKREAPPGHWGRYRQEVKAGLHGADVVVAPSRAMLTALERQYGLLPKKQVIYNGRNPEIFQPGHKEAILLTAGRLWDEAKNVAMLDAVAPRLPWPVYVAGESVHPVAGAARQHNLRGLGRLSQAELRQWYARAMIYALPARYEPFGLTILEAAMSGCALVLGDIPSLREIWGDCAAFVAPGDADGLRETVRSLCLNPRQRDDLACRSRQRSLQYTTQRMAQSYFDEYQRLRRLPRGHLHYSSPSLGHKTP